MSNEGRYRETLSTLTENWRALALRSLVALLSGLIVLFWPHLIRARRVADVAPTCQSPHRPE